MPKTTFTRKPCTLNDVREATEWIEQRRGGRLDNYYVAEEVQLEENEFFELQENLLADREWVKDFVNRMPLMMGDAVPAIRVFCPGSQIVLIIDPQGFDYPRYVGLE